MLRRILMGMAIGHLAIGLLPVLCSTADAESPSTRPAEAVTVAVMPFNVLGEAGHEWVGKAIQDGVASGVQKGAVTGVSISAGSNDAGAARVAGQAAGADYVVFGSAQFVDEQMRVSGQLINVASGKASKLVANGSVKDLFVIEDQLSDRIGRLIAPPTVKEPIARPMLQLRGDVQIYQPRYFDRDFSVAVAKPDQFRAQYDQYYYHSGSDWCCYGYGYGCGYGYGWGGSCFGWGGLAFPIGTGRVVNTSAHWSGW